MKNGNYYKLRILIRLHKIRLLYATRRFDTSLPLHLSTRSLPASLPYESTLPRSRDSPLNPSQGSSFGLPQGLTNEARLCPTVRPGCWAGVEARIVVARWLIGCCRRWQQHRQSSNPVVISKYETFKVSQHWANTHSVEKDISFCVSFEPPNHL